MPALDLYVAAFAARCDARWRPGRPTLDEPGVRGLLEPARLLVSDDRAYDTLAALGLRSGMVNVLAAAQRCTEVLSGWTAKPLTAMVCRDLRRVPVPALPDGLALRPVRRLPGDPPDGVPLEAAVAAAVAAADPAIDDTPQQFAAYLRSLPPADRLFAAVDRAGVVRATSAAGAAGTAASVYLVNTDPAWRRRGIGRAMTAAALAAARDSGARHGSLDATEAGLPIYRSLGFEALTRTTQFVRG
jgi:ribosomal protein S18 acetylase RimI-like enzyme